MKTITQMTKYLIYDTTVNFPIACEHTNETKEFISKIIENTDYIRNTEKFIGMYKNIDGEWVLWLYDNHELGYREVHTGDYSIFKI